MPRRDLVAGARHRHGRRRPRAPGRVAEVGHRRAAAHRPRRPRRRRDLQGPHLPQVPRRPARVRGRRAAHARGADRDDRRPAQPARRARAADRRDRGVGDETVDGRRAARARHAHLHLRRALARAARERARHARRPLPVGGVRRAAPAHRVGPRRRHDPRAQGRRARWRSRTPARSPTAACSRSTCPTAAASASSTRRWSTRRAPGQVFLLGATSWRIEEITRDRVVVTPAPGVPGRGAVLEGRRGRAPARARRGDRRVRALGGRPGRRRRSSATTTSTSWRPRNLLAFLREQQEATRVVPSDRTIVVERFRDEIGDWRLCVLSPYGGRVHAAWGLALSARIRDEYGLESDAIWSDDGIIVHLPDADEPPGRRARADRPRRARGRASSASSAARALFGARFRENAGRALLIPRAYPGRRTPLWQQRLKSQTLLEVAKRYAQFPIVLETYRECLRDVLDLPGLQDLLRKLHSRELSVVEVETPTASPFASSLLFDYVATYMYEGDTPNAERRAAALALDRELLRELLGQEELRELIDPGALEQVEADLQRLSERTRARLRRRAARRAAARRRPDRRGGCACACRRARPRQAGSAQLDGERRAMRAADRRRAALGRGRGRGAVPRRARRGAARRPARGVPRRRARRDGAARAPLRAHARPVRDRRAARALRRRLHARCWRRSSAPASSCAASCAPAAREREWCDPEVLRRLRRASLAALRKEIEPADQRALARFLPNWQGVDRHPAAGAGVDRLREVLVAAPGARAARRRVGARRAAAPRRRLLARVDGRSCAPPASSSGSARARSAAARAGSRSTSARTSRCSAPPPPPQGGSPAGPVHDMIRERLARGRRASSRTSWPTSPACRARSSRRRCGISCGRARSPTTPTRRCARRG